MLRPWRRVRQWGSWDGDKVFGMDLMHASLIEQLRRGLEAEDPIRLAYLFGSALCQPDPRDVDVAVWVPGVEKVDAVHRTEARLRWGAALERCLCPRRPLDLLLLNGAPLPMQFSVVRTGELLLARSEVERIRYEAWVASMCLDFAPSLRPFEESVLAGI